MELITERGGRCERCGSTRRLEAAHVSPVAHGADQLPDSTSGLLLLCKPCHMRMDRHLIDAAVARRIDPDRPRWDRLLKERYGS